MTVIYASETARRRTYKAYKFFRAQYPYPGQLKNVMMLVRAEEYGYARGWRVSWEPEDWCFCSEDDVVCDCETEHICYCEMALLWACPDPWPAEPDPRAYAQLLGGICRPDNNYRRVVAAELMGEEIANREAIAAAMDRNAAALEYTISAAGWAAL